MQEIYGDAIELLYTPDFQALCITTNGAIRRDGAAVMGRGIALQIRSYIPDIHYTLGTLLRTKGNHVHHLHTTALNNQIISFPVKHMWSEPADLELIKRSCRELMQYLKGYPDIKVLLPRPGCGNGRLNWTDVKAVISPLLNDQVYVVTWEQNLTNIIDPRD